MIVAGITVGGTTVGAGLFVGITLGGMDVAGIEVIAGAVLIAGAQALTATASNNTNTIVFITLPRVDDELTR